MTRTGQLELKLGTDAALERAGDWVERAEQWLGIQANVAVLMPYRDDGGFTSDDIRADIGDPPGHGDALGATLRKWQSQRRIVAVGRRRSSRPDAHGRGITVWRIA